MGVRSAFWNAIGPMSLLLMFSLNSHRTLSGEGKDITRKKQERKGIESVLKKRKRKKDTLQQGEDGRVGLKRASPRPTFSPWHKLTVSLEDLQATRTQSR